LGLKLIFSKSTRGIEKSSEYRTVKSLYWQGFITSATNPKAVVFFTSLFSQFVSSAQALLPQFVILSLTYMIVDVFFCVFMGILLNS